MRLAKRQPRQDSGTPHRKAVLDDLQGLLEKAYGVRVGGCAEDSVAAHSDGRAREQLRPAQISRDIRGLPEPIA